MVHETELSSNTLNFSQFTDSGDITLNGSSSNRAESHYDTLWNTSQTATNDDPRYRNYPLNKDENPEIITKKTDRVVDFTQEVTVRFLQPPTPPPVGDLVINQQPDVMCPPAPPLILREYPKRAVTPEPIVSFIIVLCDFLNIFNDYFKGYSRKTAKTTVAASY